MLMKWIPGGKAEVEDFLWSGNVECLHHNRYGSQVASGFAAKNLADKSLFRRHQEFGIGSSKF